MKTLTLNLVIYVTSIVFNLLPKINSTFEVATQKAFACKQQNAVNIISLAAWICMFVVLVFRLDNILLCMYSQSYYRKKVQPLKESLS